MECVWDQTNDEVVLCDLSVEGLVIGDIEGDWAGELDTFAELPGRVESTTSSEELMARHGGYNTELITYQQSLQRQSH